jgi:hypothetical protein
MSDLGPKIEGIHRLYCDLTGLGISLHYMRTWAWHEYFKKGFTEDDLRLVVSEIKRGIKMGKRNPGALRFRNLIESLDYFEEELAMARSTARVAARAPRTDPGRAAVLRATGRAGAPAANAARPVSDVALKVLRDFREGNK